jgi:hypothetical protein
VPPEEVRISPNVVVKEILEEFSVEAVSFDFQRISRTEPREMTSTTVNSFGERYSIPAQTLSIVVPMTGDSELLRRQASCSSVGPTPEACLRGDAVVFSVSGPNLTPEQVKADIERMRKQLTTMIGWANNDVAAWEPNFRHAITTAVNERKKRLDHAASLSTDLDIPLAAAPLSRQVQVPVRRKAVRIEHAVVGSSASDEPRLADAIYEDVLRTISGLARAIERLPRTASRFNEQELRDLLLFILNSNYEGAARGEVFNGTGKTDVLLAWHNRNAFIGECKVWRGAKQFRDAIDQLMGYVVWRDTKAALLLFIERGKPTEIIGKADGVIQAHSSFLRAVPSIEPDVRRDYLMTAKDDPQRFIRLALLPVIVPSGY